MQFCALNECLKKLHCMRQVCPFIKQGDDPLLANKAMEPLAAALSIYFHTLKKALLVPYLVHTLDCHTEHRRASVRVHLIRPACQGEASQGQ